MSKQPFQQVTSSKKEIMVSNFLGGISWAIGAFIGTTIIVGIVGFVLRQIDLLPFIGNFVSAITHYVNTHQ